MDNVLFSALTMNTQPLHVNEDFASKTEFGQRLVNGVFTFGLVVGLTVAELTEGTIVANLGYDKVVHPNPVFHGDTIYAESEIIEKREFKVKTQCRHCDESNAGAGSQTVQLWWSLKEQQCSLRKLSSQVVQSEAI